MQGMNHIRCVWLAVALLLVGCSGKRQDVTHDPAFGNFGAVMGTWKAKAPMQLVQVPVENIAGGDLILELAGALKMSMPGERFWPICLQGRRSGSKV